MSSARKQPGLSWLHKYRYGNKPKLLGVVLSTLRHAADMDYRAVVVADGCSDKDPEVQRVLMEKIFPFQARVAMVEECIGAIP